MLDVGDFAPGVWLSCPGCGQPVRVKPRPVARSAGEPEELPSASWVEDPRLAEPKPPPAPIGDELVPPLRNERRAGCLQILLLASLAGVAHAMFAGSFLMVVHPKELAMCWAFGTLAALFVAVMVNTMRWGGIEERRGPS